MMTEGAIEALKHNIEEIFEAEGTVRIECDKHTYYIVDDEITSYEFDSYGISLTGKIKCVYQTSREFGRVYIPFTAITALTGKDI